MQGRIEEIFCFHLSLDPLLRRLDIGGSNKEEELLDIRLNPQYLLRKHYEETTKTQKASTHAENIRHALCTLQTP
jgi:hypothetical protein